jgi:hypothetical protein
VQTPEPVDPAPEPLEPTSSNARADPMDSEPAPVEPGVGPVDSELTPVESQADPVESDSQPVKWTPAAPGIVLTGNLLYNNSNMYVGKWFELWDRAWSQSCLWDTCHTNVSSLVRSESAWL